MDELVIAAMHKWPNVPACYGWLGLDARGQWYMRDAGAQARGAFNSGNPGAKGALLRHEKLIHFISRNYLAETQASHAGAWYFQNGPQRVYVELESAPLILRIAAREGHALTTHFGAEVAYQGSYVDEHGHLYVNTPLGLGRIHTLDMHLAADAIEAGVWAPQNTSAATLPSQFDFCVSPQARWAEQERSKQK